jgi:hypothetical protein
VVDPLGICAFFFAGALSSGPRGRWFKSSHPDLTEVAANQGFAATVVFGAGKKLIGFGENLGKLSGWRCGGVGVFLGEGSGHAPQ